MGSKITKTVALAALMAGTAGVANATDGWYGQATVGYSFDGGVETNNVNTPPTNPGFGGESDFGNHWMGAGSFGYGFASGLRLEGEVSNRQNDSDTSPAIDLGGDAESWAGMLNLIFDLNKGGSIEPYFGIGVGYAQVEVDLNDAGPGGISRVSDEDSGVAYQFLAGIGLPISERLTLDVGYRYMAVPDLELTATTTPATTRTLDVDYDHHAATVGLRWQFAAPPPPPPPPAPPPPPPPPPPPVAAACPAADFVVYFEWDRSNLNQAALETIDSAVNRARNCNLGAVSVTGHTDTSGSPAYNIGLSERRASVVRDALVARGLPAGAISTAARGESELAQATRDGVREPLNRRTAVTISFR